MNTLDKLKFLLENCKHSCMISINDHRDYYESVEDCLQTCESANPIDPDILAEMIRKDTIVHIQFYPDTAITFYCIWHHDIDAAMDLAVQAMKEHIEYYGK